MFQRAATESIGYTKHVNSGRDKDGGWRQHKLCGLLMQASLAILLEGLPLGLTAAGFWSRPQFKGLLAIKRKGTKHECPLRPRKACAGSRRRCVVFQTGLLSV